MGGGTSHLARMTELRTLLIEIDTDNERAMGRIRIPRGASAALYMQILEHRRSLHPKYRAYKKDKALQTFLATVRLMLFWKRTSRAFREQYYAPGGRGYEIARDSFEAHKR